MKKVYFDYGSGWEDVSQYIRDNLTITDRFANSSYHYAQNVANLTMLIGDVPEVPDGSTPYYYMDGWTEATASGWIQTLSEDTLPTTRGGVYQRDFVTISGGYDYVLKLKCTSTGPSVIALVGERSDDEFELVTTANLPGGESVVTFEFTSPDDYTGLGFIWDARVNVEWNWLYIGDGVWESNLDKLKAASEVKVLIQDVVSEEDSAFEVYSEEDWTEATASGWSLTLAPDGYPNEYGGIYKKDFLTESFEIVQITLNTPLTSYMPLYLCGQITGDTFEILSSENAAPGSSTVTFTLPSATTVSGLGLIWRSDVNIEIEKIYLGDKVVTQLFQGLIAEKPSYEYDGIFENIQIDLEATDRIRKLDVEMGDFVMRNAKIMDYTDKDNSIIHQLAYQAGLTDTYIADAQILVTLSGFSPPSEKSNILSEMDKLCYENGYVLHMDVYDKIHPLPWIVASGLSSHTFGETNVIGSISVSESEREFEGVKVTYNELGEKDNVLLYRDDLPYNSDGTFTGYSIPSGYYYPLEANVIDETTGTNQIVYQEYDDTSIKAMTNKAIVEKLDFDARTAMKAFKSDYSAIVATSGHYLEYRIDGGLTPDTVVYNNKKAQVRFNNTTASGVNIYYLNVKGSCLYRTADRYSEVVTVSGSKKIDEYTTSYVFDKTTADTLAQFIAMEQDYGRFTYKFKSDDDVAVGSLVSIINDARMNQDVLILDRTYNNKEDLYEYTCKGYDKDVSAVTGRSITRTPIKDSFDVVSVGLSSYNLNILSDINGDNLQLGDASITCTVLVNGMDCTPDWTFSEATASGVLGSINGNTYTISGMFSDSGYVDILFHKEHYTDKTLRCNVARIRQGAIEYANSVAQAAKDYADGLAGALQAQVDRAIIFYTQVDDPSSGWTAAQKLEHIGDYWRTAAGAVWTQWSGTAWTTISDPVAQAAATAAQGTANGAASAAASAASAASTAQDTANSAASSATTANNLLADIASDNKLTAVEKTSARSEWNVIAAELTANDDQATAFGITTEKTAYDNAFQALATYLNAGMTWTTGIPSWLADANLGTTTDITGATFRANWKAYYDARTALLNAITAVAKQRAQDAQDTADGKTTVWATLSAAQASGVAGDLFLDASLLYRATVAGALITLANSTRITPKRYADVADATALAALTGMILGDTVYQTDTLQWYVYTTSWIADGSPQLTESDVATLIPIYEPAYLGAHLDGTPSTAKNGDSYLRYSPTSGDENRGVFTYDGTTWTRTTDPIYVYKALVDIVFICQLKDPEGAALYGTEADYGVTATMETAHIMFAIIDRLRVGDLEIFGTLKSLLMDTINSQAGETINAPTPTYWPGSALVNHCASLTDGWHAVDNTSTIDGKNVTHVVKGGGDNTVSYQASDTTVSVETTSSSTHLMKTLTSAVNGSARLYIDHGYTYYGPRPSTIGIIYERIDIYKNGSLIGSDLGWDISSDGYRTSFFSFSVAVGDVITIYSYTGFSFPGYPLTLYVKNARICPVYNTIGVWNDTDNTARVIEYYTYFTISGNIDITGLSNFATTDYNDYWRGSEFINLFAGKIANFRTLDLSGGTFNGKTCETIYKNGTATITLGFTDTTTLLISSPSYYTYTGSVILPTVEGKILFGDPSAEGQYEFWSHNIPGTTDNIISWRNIKTGKIFSILEIRAPDVASGDSESTLSLRSVVGDGDFVNDKSMHNYSGTMKVVDVFSNFGASGALGSWEWWRKKYSEESAVKVASIDANNGNLEIIGEVKGATVAITGNASVGGNLSVTGGVSGSGGTLSGTELHTCQNSLSSYIARKSRTTAGNTDFQIYKPITVKLVNASAADFTAVLAHMVGTTEYAIGLARASEAYVFCLNPGYYRLRTVDGPSPNNRSVNLDVIGVYGADNGESIWS